MTERLACPGLLRDKPKFPDVFFPNPRQCRQRKMCEIAWRERFPATFLRLLSGEARPLWNSPNSLENGWRRAPDSHRNCGFCAASRYETKVATQAREP